MFHYYLTFSFHLKLALLTQLPTSNERKIPPHLKIKPAKFHNGGFTQDLYMHICSISVKFELWWNSMNALKSVARTQRVNHVVGWLCIHRYMLSASCDYVQQKIDDHSTGITAQKAYRKNGWGGGAQKASLFQAMFRIIDSKYLLLGLIYLMGWTYTTCAQSIAT